jgi:competence protein ComEA
MGKGAMKITGEQLLGSFALLIMTALLMILNAPLQTPRESRALDVPFSTQTPGTIAVELNGESGRDGIYFIPRGTTSIGFLEMAGMEAFGAPIEPRQAPTLKSATTITLLHTPPGINVRPMAAGKRLALGIPIDINRSSMQDLELVPGIGEKTAEKILDQRSLSGSFRQLDELMLVKGIKEKRFEKLRRYLCIGC